MCFTSFISHGFLPESMLSVVLVPVIMDKAGKISSKDNYRPIHRSYFAVRPRPQLMRGGTVQGPTQATLLAQIAGLHCTNHPFSVALFVGFFPLTTILLHPEMKGECLLFMLADIMTNYKVMV